MNTQLQKESVVELPEGFTTRGAHVDDVESTMVLFNRWSRSVVGRDEFTAASALRNEWMSPGFDPATDIRLVIAPNNQIVGLIEVWTNSKPLVHPWMSGCVDPDYENLGIATWLLHWAEQRALQELPNLLAELRFAPRLGVFREAEKSRKLFEGLGYGRIRSSYHMQIEMDEPVSAPEFPEGIILRTYQPGIDAEAVYRAQTDSFRDHFGFVEEPFEDGLDHFKHFWEQPGFDPSLLFLAIDGPSREIAGISLCPSHSIDDPELGWVSTLGVCRPWRKRGIGLALLRHSFNEFYRRGMRKVGLGVDAENLTGALRLYENAGMHVQQVFDMYEKELRPGAEISVENLSK